MHFLELHLTQLKNRQETLEEVFGGLYTVIFQRFL